MDVSFSLGYFPMIRIVWLTILQLCIIPLQAIDVEPGNFVIDSLVSSDMPLPENVDSLDIRQSSPEISSDTLAVKNEIPENAPLQMLPPASFDLPKQALEWFKGLPTSSIALICAAIPGGGQLYNRKYWKVPIVWGIGLGCTYAISRYGALYNEYRTAYRDFMSENPLQYDSWKPFVPAGNDPKDYVGNDNIRNRLKQGTTQYRRNRDFSIIVSCLLYLLSFLDTYVDAEMADYDISPTLSMSSPAQLYHSQGAILTFGLKCSISF